MSGVPQVSVVMSVYNGSTQLAETLNSVLTQQGCDFEFIVVNDGSVDGTQLVLDRHAETDSRLRVLHQGNTGLTLALARGCAEARGEFIARQDAGDVSLPGRLAAQQTFLSQHPGAVMVACGVQFIGPGNEQLYRTSRSMLELDQGLRQLDIDRLSGPPHHGATMFRRDIYQSVGGYRLPFAVAQDIDLWLRLIEHGRCLGMPDVFYEARMQANSISSRRRDDQIRLSELAIGCAKLRQRGGSDSALTSAHAPSRSKSVPLDRHERACFHYFIGSCLRGHDPAGARRYYQLALRDNPFHLRALLRCITG